MFKDDRLISVLTGVVAMLVIGAFAGRLGDPAPAPSRAAELVPDRASARVGQLQRIDVLANDRHLPRRAGERLAVAALPPCGRLFVQDRVLQYLAEPGCAGEQRFAYTVEDVAGEGSGVIDLAPAEVAAGPEATVSTLAVAVLPPPPPAPPAPAEAVVAEASATLRRPPRTGDAPGVAALAPTPGVVEAPPAPPLAAPPPAPTAVAALPAPAPAPIATTPPPAPTLAAPVDTTGAAATTRVAALSPADAPCATPAAVAQDPGPLGLTRLRVAAPCAPGAVAALDYVGLSLAVPLDAAGAGVIEVPAFAPSAPARLTVAGAPLDFALTARDLNRVERVAVAWSDPVDLGVQALQVGAVPGGPGDITPVRPGDPALARARGGGFLTRFAPQAGIGQSVQIYTHVRAPGGGAGVIDLRLRGPGPGAGCADGPPRYAVVRMAQGRPSRPLLGQIAATACAGGDDDDALADAALGDMIIAPQ